MKTAIKFGYAVATALVLFGGFAQHAHAANPENVSASMTITAVRSLSVNTNNLDFEEASLAEFESGYTDEKTLVATIKSNEGWNLKIKGSQSSWVEAPWNKQVGDIRFSTSSGAGDGYSTLTTSDQSLYSGGATTPSGTQRTIYFRIRLNFETDSPGDYVYENIVLTLGS